MTQVDDILPHPTVGITGILYLQVHASLRPTNAASV